MADQTTNYKMIKPIGSEKYNLDVFNDNWDTIDGQMKANANAIETKQPKVKGAATTVMDNNLTSSRVLITNDSGKIVVSDITVAEVNTLDNIAGNIQNQINNEAQTRKDNDDALGTRIDNEATARAKAVGDEATLRQNADTNLQNQIDAKVPDTRTINGKRLNANITLTPGDIGASTSDATAQAQSTANAAQSAATKAQSTADSGVAKADAAQASANAAQTTANAAMPKTGGTMLGRLIAENNTYYSVGQVRNIFISTNDPQSTDGANGDIWLKYE